MRSPSARRRCAGTSPCARLFQEFGIPILSRMFSTSPAGRALRISFSTSSKISAVCSMRVARRRRGRRRRNWPASTSRKEVVADQRQSAGKKDPRQTARNSSSSRCAMAQREIQQAHVAIAQTLKQVVDTRRWTRPQTRLFASVAAALIQRGFRAQHVMHHGRDSSVPRQEDTRRAWRTPPPSPAG